MNMDKQALSTKTFQARSLVVMTLLARYDNCACYSCLSPILDVRSATDGKIGLFYCKSTPG
jgi:hypothetical protein